MAQLPRLVRGYDKPIHGSCAIYLPATPFASCTWHIWRGTWHVFWGGVEVLNFCFCKSCCPETQPKPISSTVIWMMVSIIINFCHPYLNGLKPPAIVIDSPWNWKSDVWTKPFLGHSHPGTPVTMVFSNPTLPVSAKRNFVKFCWWTKSCTTWDG